MTVLVHPEPVELESRELVSPRRLHNTDAMAVTRAREQERVPHQAMFASLGNAA